MHHDPISAARRAALAGLAALGLAACTDSAGPAAPTAARVGDPSAAVRPTKPTVQNGRIAFGLDATGDWEIYTMEADGSDLRRLTYAAGVDREPDWSPDARKIAYIGERSGIAELYTMNADGSGVRQVTSLGLPSANIGGPDWSPDGKRIAFHADIDGNVDLYTISPSGSGLARLTTDLRPERNPSWAPDGERIAFDRPEQVGVNFFLNVIVRELASGSETNFSNCQAGWHCSLPAWSPDGTRIAYFNNDNLSPRIKDVSTGQEFGIPAFTAHFGWSPDALRMVLRVSLGSPAGELYDVVADGAEPTERLTVNESTEMWPDWGRRAR